MNIISSSQNIWIYIVGPRQLSSTYPNRLKFKTKNLYQAFKMDKQSKSCTMEAYQTISRCSELR